MIEAQVWIECLDFLMEYVWKKNQLWFAVVYSKW
jgi:hypothetical protein